MTGYYVRIATLDKSGELGGQVQLRNREGEDLMASALVSLDFSYLVRLGLRSPHDPRVQDTIKVVDRVLKVETPSGALYHRYNDDGYGEHPDGRAFDGNGVGRAWPLLVGERGHLALQAGRGSDALPAYHLELRQRSAACCPSRSGMRAPFRAGAGSPGRPSGSAMPLLWSHAEFLKLLIARESGRPWSCCQAVAQRYGGAARAHAAWHWRCEVPIGRLEAGRALLIRGP